MAPALEATDQTVTLEIPPQTAYVAIVRLAVASFGRAAGVDEEKLDDLKIALSEACATAVLSTEQSGDGAPISISFTAADDRLEARVVAAGQTAPATDDSPQDSQGFSTRDVMSMELLRSFVDDLEVSPHDSGGTETRLVLRR